MPKKDIAAENIKTVTRGTHDCLENQLYWRRRKAVLWFFKCDSFYLLKTVVRIQVVEMRELRKCDSVKSLLQKKCMEALLVQVIPLYSLFFLKTSFICDQSLFSKMLANFVFRPFNYSNLLCSLFLCANYKAAQSWCHFFFFFFFFGMNPRFMPKPENDNTRGKLSHILVH